MKRLEIYTKDFDAGQNVVNGGLNGKVFAANSNGSYAELTSTSEALQNAHVDDLKDIFIYYQKNGEPLFKKFTCDATAMEEQT